jgi:hypothetical protein
VKSFNLSSRKAGHGRFQVGQVIFDPSAVYRLQKNAGEESNRIRGSKIEWTLPDPVDRFFQQPAHVINTLQRNLRKIPVFDLPVTVSLPSLPAKFGRFLGIRMKEAQPSFHGGRLAYTTSLRLSLALLPAPLFQAFLSLKPDGGTLLRRRQ